MNVEQDLNYKNLLQEWTQAKKLPNPKYTTQRLIDHPKDTDHRPIFGSQIEFWIDSIDIEPVRLNTQHINSVFTNLLSTKKQAEQLIARQAWQYVQHHVQSKKITYAPDYDSHEYCHVVILIDLENQQTILDDLLERINIQESHIYVNLYVSESSPLVNQTQNKQAQPNHPWSSDHIHLIVCPSTRADAADTYLIYNMGKMIESSKTAGEPGKYIIFSGDHFAKTLEECLIHDGVPALATIDINKAINFIQTNHKSN